MLVIGYGSTLRSDDGVGPAAAALIEARHLDGVQVIVCHQLTPELADPISKAGTVIFLDASLDLPEMSARVRPLEPDTSRQVMAHTASPGGLLCLSQSVYKTSPTAWLVEIPTVDMGIGEHLSPVAERGVHQAVTLTLELIARSQKAP